MPQKHNVIKTIIIFLFVWAFVASNNISAKTLTPADYEVTPEEKAVFAFFKVSGQAPDYEYWIKSQPKYKSTPSSEKEIYLIQESLRLGVGFGKFNPAEKVLTLKLSVVTKYTPAKDEKPAYISFRILNSQEAYTPTFDFPYSEDVISLIINRFANFSKLPLSETQSHSIQDIIPYENDEFDSEMEIHVRVVRSDIENPIIHPDKKQWLMVGEIAYIKNQYGSSYSDKQTKIWDYVAPWYKETFRLQNMPEEEKYPHPYDLFKK